MIGALLIAAGLIEAVAGIAAAAKYGLSRWRRAQ